jgi:hypothetical protein
MLGLILNNLDKYPLDMVVHYELEIDWGWTKNVIDEMEKRCNKLGIPFYRIKPRRTWKELYDKYDMPTRRCRWCNSHYKLDCKKQLNDWIVSQNCRPVAYIGLCADEQQRFKYDIGDWKNQDVCYPLAEENIKESVILEWAREQPIFNDWYLYFDRQGCMFCPMLTRKGLAYMYKYERETFEKYFKCVKEYEDKYNTNYWGTKPSNYIRTTVIFKWLPKLEEEERKQRNGRTNKCNHKGNCQQGLEVPRGQNQGIWEKYPD